MVLCVCVHVCVCECVCVCLLYDVIITLHCLTRFDNQKVASSSEQFAGMCWHCVYI